MAFYEMPDGRILEVSDDSVVAITHPAGHECPEGVQVGSARAAMMEELINLDTYGDSVIVDRERLLSVLNSDQSNTVTLRMSYDRGLKAGLLHIKFKSGREALISGKREYYPDVGEMGK